MQQAVLPQGQSPASHNGMQAFQNNTATYSSLRSEKGNGGRGCDRCVIYLGYHAYHLSTRCATHPWRKDAQIRPACPPPGRNPGLG